MHNNATTPHENGFAGLVGGRSLGPLELTVSAEANERFWRAAGIAPRPVLYPPIATQLAIMLTRAAIAPEEILHAGQWLRSHATALPETALTTSGSVVERYEKRGRDYVVIETVTTAANIIGRDARLWTGRSTFCALPPGPGA